MKTQNQNIINNFQINNEQHSMLRFARHLLFKYKYSLLLITSLLIVNYSGYLSFSYADSIWKGKAATSPYTPQKYYKVGDLVTVLIVESASASHKAGTKTGVSDDLSARFTHTIGRLTPVIAGDNSAAWRLGDQYKGTGQTERASSLKAKVACWVKEVMPNGNLVIEGNHKLSVNDEQQEIIISGIIRSKDISIENTVYSHQVASADISIKGTGVVEDAQQPGWLTRFLNWLF